MKQQRRGAVIFDFDGTIVDSLGAVIKVFEDLAKRPKRFSAEEIAGMRHLSLPELAAELKVSRWKMPWLLFLGRRMMRHHLRSIKLHPGIAKLIKQLYDENHQLYILSSNSRQNIYTYLKQHELDQYFIEVYGSASLLGKAPKLKRLVRNEHLDKATTWYIGDEIRDIVAAKAVGVKIGAVTWGYNTHEVLVLKQPDALFDTTAQLAAGVK